MTQTLKVVVLTLLLSLTLSACVYKISVQQGNLITHESITKIHTGMSIDDITALLGKPMLDNLYQNNSFVYVYTMRQGNHPMTLKRLTVYFANNKVTHYILQSI